MGTVRRSVRRSAACAKPGGQLTQHLPCCLCAHSTISLSPVTEYSLRARTPLPARALEFLQTPLIPILISILILTCPLFLFPQTQTDLWVRRSNYHVIGLFYLCTFYFTHTWCVPQLTPVEVSNLHINPVCFVYIDFTASLFGIPPTPLHYRWIIIIIIIIEKSTFYI